MKSPTQPWRLLLLVLLLLFVGGRRGEAAGFAEDFTSDPTNRGWRYFGDPTLFQWSPSRQAIEVTWNSEKPNSYFYRPLENVLARSDDFNLRFDLQLQSIEAGARPGRPSTFEIAAGFLNVNSATHPGFSRGTGRDSPNLVEFDYFPPDEFIAPTVTPVITSSNSQFATSFTYPLEMTVDDLFHIELAYTASNQTLATTMTRNGLVFGPIQKVTLGASFTDFRVDAVGIASYSDVGDTSGSVLARGVIDNLEVTLPAPPISDLTLRVTNGVVYVEFSARTNWVYALERTRGFTNWESMPPARAGSAGPMTLVDDTAEAWPGGFYRVRAQRP